MFELDTDIMIGIAFAIGVGLLLYFFSREPSNQQYQSELKEILTKDENKVKGRFG